MSTSLFWNHPPSCQQQPAQRPQQHWRDCTRKRSPNGSIVKLPCALPPLHLLNLDKTVVPISTSFYGDHSSHTPIAGSPCLLMAYFPRLVLSSRICRFSSGSVVNFSTSLLPTRLLESPLYSLYTLQKDVVRQGLCSSLGGQVLGTELHGTSSLVLLSTTPATQAQRLY